MQLPNKYLKVAFDAWNDTWCRALDFFFFKKKSLVFRIYCTSTILSRVGLAHYGVKTLLVPSFFIHNIGTRDRT